MSKRHIRLSLNEPDLSQRSLTPNLASSRLMSYFNFLQQRWGKFSEPHMCALIDVLKGTKIVHELINSGVFIESRRWLRQYVMINKKHPYTKLVFKSMTEIKQEEVKHLLNYPYIVHPFSMFCLHTEFFMALVHIIYLGHIVPNDINFITSYNDMKWMKFHFDLIMTWYIITNFFTGYLDNENMVVEMRHKRVAMRYLKTYFIWDLLSCLPSYLIFVFMAYDTRYTYWHLFKWLSMFRMARYGTIYSASNTLQAYFNMPVELYITIQIFLVTCLILLCCLGLLAFWKHYHYLFIHLPVSQDREIAKKVAFKTIRALFGVIKLEIVYTNFEAIANILITVVSFVLQRWILAKLYILWQRYIALSQVGEDNYQQLSGYLKNKGISQQIRKEIYSYYTFRFQRKFYDESNINRILTENLRKSTRLNPLIDTPDVNNLEARGSYTTPSLTSGNQKYVLSPLKPLIRTPDLNYFEVKRSYYYLLRQCFGRPDGFIDGEIPYYRLDQGVEKIKFVRLLPNQLIMEVLSDMNPRYYCPGDIVFRVNSPSRELYFILSGTVALHDASGIEVCHLEDGAYYGDKAVVIPQTHIVTMTALAPSKIFVLKSSVLQKILAPFPDIKEKVMELTRTAIMNRKSDWLIDTSKWHRSVIMSEADKYSNIRGPNSVTFM